MAIEHGEPDRGLVAECHRQRLLKVGPARHWRVAIASGQIGKNASQGIYVFLDNLQPVAHLEDDGRVHDVLGGRAPMDVASGVAALLCYLVDEGQDRIADDVSLVAQQIEVELGNVRELRDLFGRFGWNPPAPRLGAGQRDLDLGITADQCVVREDLAHPGCAESVAEKDRVEDGGGGWDSGAAHGKSPDGPTIMSGHIDLRHLAS